MTNSELQVNVNKVLSVEKYLKLAEMCVCHQKYVLIHRSDYLQFV